MSRSERGLTLLEVMGAIMLLGLLYAALATRTTEGVWSEATSRRRLEASLLADRELSRIEAQHAVGNFPQVSERQAEGYAIQVNIDKFAPPVPEIDPSSALAAALGENLAENAAAAVPDVFGRQSEAQPSVLKRVVVRVGWRELGRRDHVRRVTYLFDQGAAEQLVPEPDAAGAGS